MTDLSLLGDNQKKAFYTIKNRKSLSRKKKFSLISSKSKNLGNKVFRFRL